MYVFVYTIQGSDEYKVLSMVFINMFVKLIFLPKSSVTVLAVVSVGIGKMDVFNVFPKVALLTEIFAT